jgi:V/A-type H+-transporting ATPase subunit D
MRDIPSKTALLERREELKLVTEGKGVLEERRDILARELLDLIKQTEQLATAYEQRHAAAWQALQYAVLRYGPAGLSGFEVSATPDSPQWFMANRVGVPWLSAPQLPQANAPQVTDSWYHSPELQQLITAFHELQMAAFRLAQADNNLRRLSQAFKSVQQRVNALEHIVLPETRHAIKFIEEGLEQIEREQLAGVLWLKRREESNGS